MAKERVAKGREGNEIEFSRIVAFSDGVFSIAITLLVLNLLYLGWIVLIPFSSEVLGEYGDQTAAVVLYAANLFGVVLIGMLMAADAHRGGITSADVATQREGRNRSIYIASVFLLSIPVAFLSPGLASLMWLVLFADPTRRLATRVSRRPSG